MDNLKEYLQKLNEDISTTVGKHNHIPDSEFDIEELKKGIIIEKEHSDNIEIRKAIAKDHLSEFPDYYTRLIKMEKEAELYWKDNK